MKKELENPDLKVTGFSNDTLVHVRGSQPGENLYIPDLKKIQFVGVGDEVLTCCEKTGKTAYREVIEKFHHYDIPTYVISCYVNNPPYHVNTTMDDYVAFPVDVTAEQRFWVEGKGWTATMDLQPGDVVASCEGALVTTVKEVIPNEDNMEVYNFTVADLHTYFVGVEGLWVQDKAAD